jgi:pyrimidine-nucleoside phosphorylase
VNLTVDEFRRQVGTLGLALIGQTAEFAPADRKLYALRDVTATVESIPLICASILSKKMAAGIDALVLDVKFGRGAFMKDKARARELAVALTSASVAMGKPARAVMTDMNEPLGHTVGNALELRESIECLQGKGPRDVMEVTHALGVQMLLLAGVEKDAPAADARLEKGISDGSALAKFREMVVAQGGDPRVVDDPSRLAQAGIIRPLASRRAGFVADVDALEVALAALRLGAGRAKAADRIDPAVGISRLVKSGDPVKAGEDLCMVHASSEAAFLEASAILERAIAVADKAPAARPVIGETIG